MNAQNPGQKILVPGKSSNSGSASRLKMENSAATGFGLRV